MTVLGGGDGDPICHCQDKDVGLAVTSTIGIVIARMPGLMQETARSADSNDSTGKPASCNACSLPMRTAASSSTRSTLIASSIMRLRRRHELNRELGATFWPVRRDKRTTEFTNDAR